MNEKFLRYNMNLMDGSVWLIVSSDPVMEILGFSIQEIGELFIQDSFMTEREGLESYQISYVFEGEQCLTYRGQEHLMGSGSVFFIDCRESYKIEGHGYKHMMFVHFENDKAAHYCERFYTLNNHSPVLSLAFPCFIDKGIAQLLTLFKEGTTAEASYRGVEIITSLITQILMKVFPRKKDVHFNECVTTVLNYLQENYHRKITLNDLVNETHMSKFHLSRLFRHAMNDSPIEYLLRLRINKAKELLLQTTYTVSKVSETVGFENTSHFIKLFRVYEKFSPGEFRKKWG